MSKTSNALEIIRRRYNHDEETQEMLAEERVKSLAATAIYEARTTAGLTQQQLAELVGTKQPVIARLEDADYEGHTTAMLNRIAVALKQRLELRFVPLQTEAQLTFSANQQTETNTLIAGLLNEVRNLKSDLAAEIRGVKAELTDVKADVRSLGKQAKPARSSKLSGIK